MTPRRAAASARRSIQQLARPAGTFDASRYFRGTADLGFYNVGTDRMRELARGIYDEHRDEWTVDDAMTFADALMPDRYLEVKFVGIEVVARYRKQFTPRLLDRWKRWLAAGYSANWATTDAICGTLIGPLLMTCERLRPRLRAWARHRSLWVRRASIVGLIGVARRGESLDLIYAIAQQVHRDREDLIQKAVGWALREAGKTDMARLERYLLKNGPQIPRTTLRYAIERFPTAKRRRLLSGTRRT